MILINPFMPVETAADLPRFCGRCGRPLTRKVVRERIDRLTGRRASVLGAVCSRWWFWTDGTFANGHEAFVVSPRPTPPPERD